MNFYLIEKPEENKKSEMIIAIKQFLKERLAGATEDSLLNLASEGVNPFFLKTSSGILWVRIFEEMMDLNYLVYLQKEFEKISQMFRQKIQFYLFAPGFESSLKTTEIHSHDVCLFEYFFLKSRFGQGVAIREARSRKVSVPSGRTDPRASARLEREELSELIDLSLELKS